MNRTTLATVVILSASCLASAPVHAQTPTLSPGTTHTATVNDEFIGQPMQRYRYSRNVERDTRLQVRIEWLAPVPPETDRMNVNISDAGTIAADADADVSMTPGGAIIAHKTFVSDGAVYISLTFPRTSLGHRYTITVTEERHAVKRSITSGLHVAGGWNSTTFASQFSTETGTGASYRFGLGFGPVTVYAERQTAEMVAEGENPDPADGYTLNHTDLGARVHLFSERHRFRPFGQFAVGQRRLVSGYTDTEAEGIALTPGAGIEVFLLTRLSIEGSYTRGTGDVDRARATDGEWQDLPEANVIKGTSTRLSVQGVFHF